MGLEGDGVGEGDEFGVAGKGVSWDGLGRRLMRRGGEK